MKYFANCWILMSFLSTLSCAKKLGAIGEEHVLNKNYRGYCYLHVG